MNFLKSLVKSSGNEYAAIANDGLEADVSGFIDTGSYAFNALVSGSLTGGIPNNKILGIAGESATGKTTSPSASPRSSSTTIPRE